MTKAIGLFFGSAGSHSGGPERYESELLRTMAAMDQKNQYEVFCLFKDAPSVIGVTQENIRYHTIWPQIRPISMLTSLPIALSRYRLDSLHATFIPPPISPHPYVFTLVCSSMFEHPEFYPPMIRLRLIVLMRRALKHARLILCVSKHIQDVIQERFAIPSERTAVVHLAASNAFREIPKELCRDFVKERYGIDSPYFLFSGRWERRKNITRILEAFHQFKSETASPFKLVLTGERTWAEQSAIDVINDLDLKPHLIDLGKSPVDELPYLYAGARALLYPSLWEGFGLPIVEAMKAGTPVITGNSSSMAEIGGNAALLVDPESVEDIAAAIHSLATDDALCASLSARGLARSLGFSWEITARQSLQAYERLWLM